MSQTVSAAWSGGSTARARGWRALALFCLACRGPHSWAQQSAEIWSRAIVPESPEKAPNTLVLPGPWRQQMDEAIAATEREGREFAGCLLYDVLPTDLARRERAADAALRADPGSRAAALAMLTAEVRDARTNGPVVGSTYAGLAYSLEANPKCGPGGSYFHTHPKLESQHDEMTNYPSGADFTAPLTTNFFTPGSRAPIRVIRSATGYYALVPTKQAVDILGFETRTRRRVEDMFTHRVAWMPDMDARDLLESGLQDLVVLPQQACGLRGGGPAAVRACMMGMLARLAQAAGHAIYFGDTNGTLTRAAPGVGALDLSLNIAYPYLIAANVMGSQSWPPSNPADLLQEPRWERLVPPDMRESYGFWRPLFERAGMPLTDRQLAFLRFLGQGGTQFRGDAVRGWPQVSFSTQALAKTSAQGIKVWLGDVVCASRASQMRPRLAVVVMSEHQVPTKAESMADVKPAEGGRTAIVVASDDTVYGTALRGRVTGGVPIYEGELPVGWSDKGTTRWKGRFIGRTPRECQLQPYFADGEGTAEHRDRDGNVVFTLRGTASAGKFTGDILNREGKVFRTVRDFPELID